MAGENNENKIINELLKTGSYEVMWDGSAYASGIYFYRIVAEEYLDVKRLILAK